MTVGRDKMWDVDEWDAPPSATLVTMSGSAWDLALDMLGALQQAQNQRQVLEEETAP